MPLCRLAFALALVVVLAPEKGGAAGATSDPKPSPIIAWSFDSKFGELATSDTPGNPEGVPLNMRGSQFALETQGLQSPAWQFLPAENGIESGLAADLPPDLTEFTLVCVVKRGEVGAVTSVQYIAGIPGQFFLRLTEANNLEAGVWTGEDYKQVGIGVAKIQTDDGWFTVTVKVRKELLSLSVNDELGDSIPISSFRLSGSPRLIVGACPFDPTMEHFAGAMDSLRFYTETF